MKTAKNTFSLHYFSEVIGRDEPKSLFSGNKIRFHKNIGEKTSLKYFPCRFKGDKKEIERIILRSRERQSCCFVGHRDTPDGDELRGFLRENIEKLIVGKGVKRFLFGSRSNFDKICFGVVTELKRKYPYIKRIYVRGEYEYIGEEYREYLLKIYDDTYFPKNISGAGKAVYIERNYHMIDNSRYCIFYCIPDCRERSGTKIAVNYAKKKGKTIFLPNFIPSAPKE